MFRTRRSALASGADCVVDLRFADRAGDKLRYRLQLCALSLPRQYPSRTASQELFPNDREQLIAGPLGRYAPVSHFCTVDSLVLR